MNTFQSYILILAVGLIMSCKSEVNKNLMNTPVKKTFIKKLSPNSLPMFDTTVILSNIPPSKYNGLNLSDSLAKAILYDHFGKLGYYNQDNLPEIRKMKHIDYDNLCVDYDTIYNTSLNNNRYADAVITYWLIPVFASGHCYQPLRAIIIDTDKGYTITNEEFIPDNYAIDSVVSVNGKPTIFGYDYECANDKILKKLRITLKY